jgi:hypothetical protein
MRYDVTLSQTRGYTAVVQVEAADGAAAEELAYKLAMNRNPKVLWEPDDSFWGDVEVDDVMEVDE